MLIIFEFVEASLASGLPCAADHDRHGYSQASSLGRYETTPKGHRVLLPRNRQGLRLRGVHPPRRDDAICHGHKLSIC